jgi:hypothetical protein
MALSRDPIGMAHKYLSLLCGLLILSGCPVGVMPPGMGGEEGAGFERAMTSGRAALVGNQAEQAGYGLYSYLLLRTPPPHGNRERYLHAFSAFVTSIPDIADLEVRGFSRSKLNITYVLLQTTPPPVLIRQAGTPEQVTAFSEWAYYNYNYARARSLLKSVPDAKGDGPYLISTLQPLSDSQSAQAGYLYQDLSSVEAGCIKLWIGEFLGRASRPMTRDRAAAEELAQTLREVLAKACGRPQQVGWRNAKL